MPCCCASNIKAALVIGIVLAVFYALEIICGFKLGKFFEITKFLSLVSASILAYGAHSRISKAMSIYIGSAILMIVSYIVVAMREVVKTFNGEKTKELCGDHSLDHIVKFIQGYSLDEMCLDGPIWYQLTQPTTLSYRDKFFQDPSEDPSNDLDKICTNYRRKYQICSDGMVYSLIFVILLIVGVVIFYIWTIIIAKNAKKEIEDKQGFHLIQAKKDVFTMEC